MGFQVKLFTASCFLKLNRADKRGSSRSRRKIHRRYRLVGDYVIRDLNVHKASVKSGVIRNQNI